MMIIVGFIIGLAIGAGAIFVWKNNEVTQTKEKYQKQLEAQKKQLEQDHQRRIEETTQRLQQDYQQQIEEQIGERVQQEVAVAQENAQAEVTQIRQELEQTRQQLAVQENYQAQVEELRKELESFLSERRRT